MKMLFEFSSPDLENTTIIDSATGHVIYHVSTPGTCVRTRSRSTTSMLSLSSYSSSRERVDIPDPKVTYLTDRDGNIAAEIFWESRVATVIRIGEEVLAGTRDLFDASCVRVLEDETLVPTRMEYTWRTSPDELTLLDDDYEVIGRYHPNCMEDGLTPALLPGAGHDYFELEVDQVSEDEIAEIFVSYLLMHTLRERMYSLTKILYGQQLAESPKNPLQWIRLRAGRSIANLRESFRRTVSP